MWGSEYGAEAGDLEELVRIEEETNMTQVSTLEGLPDPVAKAIIETVNNLKSSYRAEQSDGRAKVDKSEDVPSRR